MDKKPNILFLFTDDQRFNTINSLGNNEIITPNMDKLVRKGTTFTNACIPCGTSIAICMPSRAMLNTGRKLFHIQGAGEQIPKEHITIGQVLQKNGYRTFGTGKWHNGKEFFNRSFSEGAEIFFGGMTDHWNVPAFNYDPSGKYDKVCLITDNFFYSNETRERNCDHIHAGKHSSELVSDASIDFINNYEDDKPFYMYISYLAPYDPRTMPKKYLDMYNPEQMELPKNFLENHPFDNGALKVRDELLASFPRTQNETRRHLAEYYAMITHLDAHLGRILDALEQKGCLDNTIIIFSSDNGLALGSHGLFGKQNCYDHSVRVPLIFSGPEIPKNAQSEAYVYLFDIFPTICDLIGIEITKSVEGSSLVDAMYNPGEKIRDYLYFAYLDRQRAIKDQQYKLVEYIIKRNHSTTQLFDLKNDPLELFNLAANPEYKDKIVNLRQKMYILRDEWDDHKSHWGKRFWRYYNEKN
jgi:arylsulfatase A-like enzyme